VAGVSHDVTETWSTYHARNDPHATNLKGLLISDFCKRVQHLADTCDYPSLFTSPDKLQNCARGCVETAASLVLCANVKPESFGGLEKLLRKLLGEIEKIREPSAAGSGGSFLTHWACLYLVTVTRRTLNQPSISNEARLAIGCLSRIPLDDGGERTGNDEPTYLLKVSRKLDTYFEGAHTFCVGLLKRGLSQEELTAEQLEALGSGISLLGRATLVSDHMVKAETHISHINGAIDYASLPGISLDEFVEIEIIEPTDFFKISSSDTLFMPQIVFLNQRLRLLGSYHRNLHNGLLQETIGSLRILWDHDDRYPSRSVVGRRQLMERQLWRLLDLRDAGGFGFLVELFLLMLARLLSMASSQDAHSALYVGTFRVITSGWRQHKHSIGAQRVILNVGEYSRGAVRSVY
jgi:hypothetical protein